MLDRDRYDLCVSLRFGTRSLISIEPGEEAMDVTVWLPALFLLGLIGMGLMFAFVAGCNRV